ncbi:alpha-D-ribose 1-methylphosphonate 5-triphosphate synthase subunit PhnH [Enhydrobacter aerosaccus]|uniref:Alpha-D-ribose 1-methylphosphonate 5-triphosphate synthase subunit PhnH n=1 Tax=Enhydrobacter aerosaccus TaxID=225324 RepID=A0A1T4SGU6_9HYPH|nr:phosphonate C-P lyase system protein PhnH [Enhydrobacter aerosaccus]SKA27158.1 alpha-D-ribose 1-methylphosphonate 5-triphosphate synthase subunit PhnH [Enhydrobacter aerosaccus]
MTGITASDGLAPGLADPAHDSQRLFRAILDAFAHPGRIVALPEAPAAVAPMSQAATAFILTLIDRDTPLWLAPSFDTPAVRDFVRFHTGAALVAFEADALFGLASTERCPLFDGFPIGNDAYPDRSATVVVEVPSLRGGPSLTLRGPGIDGQAQMAIPGLTDDFVQERAANHALFPCGVDLVFTAGSELLALPRSIVVER